jgi:hypothetical protein
MRPEAIDEMPDFRFRFPLTFVQLFRHLINGNDDESKMQRISNRIQRRRRAS